MRIAQRKTILELSKQIAREFEPDRIILFGSYAYGNPTPDSDVDMLIILPFKGKPAEKAVEIRLSIRPTFPVDIIARTPEKIKERIDLGDDFIREILMKGKVLYENNNKRMGNESGRRLRHDGARIARPKKSKL